MSIVIDKLPSWYFSRSQSNKTSREHYFGYVYDTIFLALVALKKSPLKVLELGVSYFGEGSGHAFSKMPYVGQFVGVDINPIVSAFENGNVFLQKNTDTMDCINTLKEYAPFDLIIHDANHTVESQIYFFKQYSQLLASPGYMVCEDMQEVDHVVLSVDDDQIHKVEVPPMYSPYGWTKLLVKANLPSVYPSGVSAEEYNLYMVS